MFDWYAYVQHCFFLGRPLLVLWHDLNNLAIFASYALISGMIEYVRRIRNIPLNYMAICFAVFICSCGVGHLMAVGSMHAGWYLAQETVNTITAVASVGTAIYLYAMLPLILRMPTPSEHFEMAERLAAYEEPAVKLIDSLQFPRLDP